MMEPMSALHIQVSTNAVILLGCYCFKNSILTLHIYQLILGFLDSNVRTVQYSTSRFFYNSESIVLDEFKRARFQKHELRARAFLTRGKRVLLKARGIPRAL
jgi:hypothetical protein